MSRAVLVIIASLDVIARAALAAIVPIAVIRSILT